MSEFQPEIYAIDFGTSNSLLAAAHRGGTHPAITLGEAGEDPSILRSVLFFPDAPAPDAPNCYVGQAALSEYVAHGSRGRLIRSLKRFLPMRGFTRTSIGKSSYSLEELIGAILRELRQRADRFFGAQVKRALLGRPARFSRSDEDDALAEQRLRAAAELAGFEQVDFCPEPVAAARDFRLPLERPRLVLVADFGAGTSDFSLVRMSERGFALGDVLAVGGVSVAGDALDGSLMRSELASYFGAEVSYRVPFGENVLTMPKPLMEKLCSPAEMSLLARRDVQSFLADVKSWSLGESDREHLEQLQVLVEDTLGFVLFEAIERAKKELSERAETAFSFHVPGIDIDHELQRAHFEKAAKRELESIVAALDQTLARANVDAGAVDFVCLTGGTARVPFVAAALRERFGNERLPSLRSLHAVTEGLALHAQRMLRGEG